MIDIVNKRTYCSSCRSSVTVDLNTVIIVMILRSHCRADFSRHIHRRDFNCATTNRSICRNSSIYPTAIILFVSLSL